MILELKNSIMLVTIVKMTVLLFNNILSIRLSSYVINELVRNNDMWLFCIQ